jgi:hypothetical protein
LLRLDRRYGLAREEHCLDAGLRIVKGIQAPYPWKIPEWKLVNFAASPGIRALPAPSGLIVEAARIQLTHVKPFRTFRDLGPS